MTRIRCIRVFLTGSAVASLLMITAAAEVRAQGSPVQRAIARAVGDAALQWGPCPAFLPPGCQIAVLHGDPAQPNADIFLRVPPRSELAAHSHTSPERMVLISGELHVTYQGQDPAVLRPGMYAYGPAKLVHHARCTSSDSCVLFIAFEGPVDAIPVAAPPR